MNRLTSPTSMFVCIGLTLPACATVPVHFEGLSPPNPATHAAQDHICGMGVVPEAEGIEAAETKAQANVAKTIRSTLQADFVERRSSGRQGSQSYYSQEAIDRIAVSTDFSRAELIRVVDRFGPHDGEYRAWACLNRQEAAGLIRQDMAPDVATFEVAVSSAHKAAADQDLAAFSTYMGQVAELNLGDRFNLMESILRGTLTEAESFRQAHLKLVTTAGELRDGVSLAIAVEGAEKHQRAQIEDGFRQAARRIGVQSTSGATACSEGTVTHLLEVNNSPDCHRASSFTADSVCELKFETWLRACNGTGETHAVVTDPAMSGRDNHGRDEVALPRAWEKFTSEALDQTLREALRVQIPLE